MNNEFRVFVTVKYTLLIGLILFVVSAFIGITMLFLSNNSTLYIITGIANLLFSIYIAYTTIFKVYKRNPEIIFNESGIWLKGMDKLYNWTIIQRIDVKEVESENELLNKTYLTIEFNNGDITLSVPLSDLEINFDGIKKILNLLKKEYLIKN